MMELGYCNQVAQSGVQIPAGAIDFVVLKKVKTNSGAYEPPVHWLPGSLSPTIKWLIIHLHVARRLRMSGTVTTLPCKLSQHIKGQLYSLFLPSIIFIFIFCRSKILF